jgi:hypothetical protein
VEGEGEREKRREGEKEIGRREGEEGQGGTCLLHVDHMPSILSLSYRLSCVRWVECDVPCECDQTTQQSRIRS